MDKRTEALLEALKQALAGPGELPLFKSGKVEGLFASRTGVNGEVAAQALRDGLLDVVRTETKGKTTVEWVRLTPRGVDFLHEHESPAQALRDLHAVLQTNREKMPLWLAELQSQVQALGRRFTEDVQCWTQRLDALSQQVEAALRRMEEGQAKAQGEAHHVPWAPQALGYLDRRRAGGGAGECPMPELFAAVRDQQPDLTVTAFHDGLRRLRDRQVVRLVPFAGPMEDLPEPEYALPDGTAACYYVARP
jgi:hypothetical protein